MRLRRNIAVTALKLSCLLRPLTSIAAPESQFFDARGVKILVEGSGEPVVLIHGLDSSAAMNWVVALQSVRSDWRVIEIQDAGHITCIMKQQFKDDLEKWIDANRGK